MLVNTSEDEVACSGLVSVLNENQRLWAQSAVTAAHSPVPLVSVDVEATVVLTVAEVAVRQVYVNRADQAIDAFYYFPLTLGAAVTRFEVEIGKTVIKAQVKESESESGMLIRNKEEETARGDVFKIRVGILKPGVKAKITIVYVSEVKYEIGNEFTIRFVIPSTIAPRFSDGAKAKDNNASSSSRKKGSPAPAAALSIRVEISLQCGIQHVQSPSHSDVSISQVGPASGGSSSAEKAWHKTLVELAGEVSAIERDFELVVETEKVHKPVLYSERKDDGSTAVMVHMVPKIPVGEIKSELIFLVDRSSSMEGKNMELANSAIVSCLRSLQVDAFFNIVSYGSCHRFLFHKSVKITKKNVEEAAGHVNKFTADFGGTEIFQPLKAIYSRPGVDGYFRQVFIFTDGDVVNPDAVFGIVRANLYNTRVYALGIGCGAGHDLVEGIAKNGGGTAEFADETEVIEKALLGQVKHSLQAGLTNIHIKWKGLESSQGHRQSPKFLTPVLEGSQILAIGLFKSDPPKAVKLTAMTPSGPLTARVKYSPDNDIGESPGNGMLHRLAAVKLVRELELEGNSLTYIKGTDSRVEIIKRDIIKLAIENGITSKFTSFMTTDPKSDSLRCPENWALETKRGIPAAMLARVWGCHTLSIGSNASTASTTRLRSRVSPSASDHSRRTCPALSRGASKRSTTCPPALDKKPLADKSPRVEVAAPAQPAPPAEDMRIQRFDKNRLSVKECRRRSIRKDPISLLSRLQTYDGSFELSDELCKIIQKPLKFLQRAARQLKFNDKLMATSLAIAFLEKAEEPGETWELTVRRAREWVALQLETDMVDRVVYMASAYV